MLRTAGLCAALRVSAAAVAAQDKAAGPGRHATLLLRRYAFVAGLAKLDQFSGVPLSRRIAG